MGAGEGTPLVGSAAAAAADAPWWPHVLAIVPAILGNFIEFYDYGIYTALTAELETNLYGGADTTARSNGVWLAFALGQAARPFGGALLGYFADRYGRQPAMLVATAGMLVGTAGIGLVPTQRCCGPAWGWVGLVLVYVFRVIQGMSAAGEVVTVLSYAIETAPRQHAGKMIGFTSAAASMGFLVSSVMSSVMELSLIHI